MPFLFQAKIFPYFSGGKNKITLKVVNVFHFLIVHWIAFLLILDISTSKLLKHIPRTMQKYLFHTTNFLRCGKLRHSLSQLFSSLNFCCLGTNLGIIINTARTTNTVQDVRDIMSFVLTSFMFLSFLNFTRSSSSTCFIAFTHVLTGILFEG